QASFFKHPHRKRIVCKKKQRVGLALTQSLDDENARIARCFFLERAEHYGRKTCQMVFQYVIGYTPPNAFDGYFLAESPRDQDKRNLISRLANLRQGIHASPVPKTVIGQND